MWCNLQSVKQGTGMQIKESHLHLLGKEVFADAAGKTINLPPAQSPRFTPPRKFRIKRVQTEYPLPVGIGGRRPDIILTDDDGIKIVVEISNAYHKGRRYFDDMDFGGFSLILELDVSKWRENKSLRPDFSSRSMLQDMIDQCKWLSAGKPRPIRWVEQELPYCIYTEEKTREDLKQLEAQGVGEDQLNYEHLRKLGATPAIMTCFFLWRDNAPLPGYTILKVGDGRFLAAQFSIEPKRRDLPIIDYWETLPVYTRTFHSPGESCPKSCQPLGKYGHRHREGQVFKHWEGKPRMQWKQAVDDIFAKVAPDVTPIYDKPKLQPS